MRDYNLSIKNLPTVTNCMVGSNGNIYGGLDTIDKNWVVVQKLFSTLRSQFFNILLLKR